MWNGWNNGLDGVGWWEDGGLMVWDGGKMVD